MKTPTAKRGRPARYDKTEKKTYCVSREHVLRVKALRKALGVSSASDVIEEAVIELFKARLG